jgi:hypothetical protein
MTNCTCRLLLFSGKPDPRWQPSEEEGREFLDYCKTLSTCENGFASDPPLGYRGVEFIYDEETITAYAGCVELKTPQSTVFKKDSERKFEQMIIRSAPRKIQSLLTDFLNLSGDQLY